MVRKRIRTKSALAPFWMLIGAALIYGLMPSLNKIAATSGVSPLAYAFWVSAGAAVILFGACAYRGTLPRLGWEYIRTYLVSGTLGMAFPVPLLTHAAPHLPAGAVALVLALAPLMTYFLALVLKMERFRWLSTLGLLFGLGGVCALAAPEGSLPEPGATSWAALVLIATMSFAVLNILAARLRLPDAPSVTLACGLVLGASAVLLPVMAVTGTHHLFMDAPILGTLAIISAAFVMAGFIYLFYETVRRAGPVFFSQFVYLNTLTGILWATALLEERLSIWVWIALALMFVGVLLVNTGMRRSSVVHEANERE